MASTDWQIGQRTGRCAVTDRPFEEGEEFYAVLFERSGELQRVEYSIEGWTGPPEESFCFWKTRIPTRDSKPEPMAVGMDTLVELFESLDETDEPARVRFRFVLALFLMRKRRLRYETTEREDDREYWKLRLVGSATTYRMENPGMSDEQTEQVRRQMEAVLLGTTPHLSEESPIASTADNAASADDRVPAAGEDGPSPGNHGTAADDAQEEPA